MINFNRFGWIKDRPDYRDFKYSKIKPKVITLPEKIDLRDKCSKIEDQGDLGSCTAQALVGNLEFLEKKKKDLSRLFVYYNERVLIGEEDNDSGAYLRDGIKTLAKEGVCSEYWWRYIISKFARKPSFWCYWLSKFHKITSYHRIDSLNDMKTCLADGYPFVFGFNVYESFESDKVVETGIIPVPKINEELVGGHAIMAVGYDNEKKAVLIRNSWGTGWGESGYGWFPYDYISNKEQCDDFWTVRRWK